MRAFHTYITIPLSSNDVTYNFDGEHGLRRYYNSEFDVVCLDVISRLNYNLDLLVRL